MLMQLAELWQLIPYSWFSANMTEKKPSWRFEQNEQEIQVFFKLFSLHKFIAWATRSFSVRQFTNSEHLAIQ